MPLAHVIWPGCFHGPQTCARKPTRDVDSLVQIPDVDDEVPAELFWSFILLSPRTPL